MSESDGHRESAAGSSLQSSFAPVVFRLDETLSVDRGNGARTTPCVTHSVGATSFINGVTAFEPGAAIAHHTHNCVESVMVIEGDAVVDIDGVETRLGPFDATFVPGNIPHHFRNASDEKPMRIFWTYASPDATRTLTETGATARVDAEQRGGNSGDGPYRDTVVEIVELSVRPGAEENLEAAVAAAAPLFQRARGCRTLELTKIVESPDQYRLFVEWSALEDHTVSFRDSEDFQQWRALVMPHLQSPPQATHVRGVAKFF